MSESDPHPLLRPRAVELMRAAERQVESTEGLLLGALAIAAQIEDPLDEDGVRGEIEGLRSRIATRVHSGNQQAVLAHAHQVLFEEESFDGDREDYHAVDNSNIAAVLRRRSGMPITLALIYKLVLEGVGVKVHGIGAPGHFLVGVHGADGTVIVDPFFAGRVLTVDEALQRARIAMDPARPVRNPLPWVDNREWLGRMLRNLVASYAMEDARQDCEAVGALGAVLGFKS